MLFNSIDFAIFLPIVFILYWLFNRQNLKFQNLLIVLASYVFYSFWDWRFLALIIFSTLIDYFVGRQIGLTNNRESRKKLLWLSIIVNIGFLGVFKYYNFFLENFIKTFSLFGLDFTASTLKIILPVGISFYTFQTLSYTIDVYKNKIKPTNNFISFAAFVSFFPQLVAGPIERASHLLPQFQNKRNFSYPIAINGLRQILWGLFKKIVIADNCAEFANIIFNNSDIYSGSTLVLGAILFTFQIYGDFSGYTDIAIGTSRLFGFDLMKNFNFPYFSRDIAEFWRRWHISLSTWFRDYVYIPLGGSRGSTIQKVRNIFIIFLVSGFWHGANWTFIVWGALNAIYFLPLLLTKRNRTRLDIVANNSVFPSLKEISGIIITFSLTMFGWIIFRADNLNHAYTYITRIFSSTIFKFPVFHKDDSIKPIIFLIIGFIIIEWIGRRNNFAIEKLGNNSPKIYRWSFYMVIIFIIFYFAGEQQEFIYFQF